MISPAIYLDHAATSFPRSVRVGVAMGEALQQTASPWRGTHRYAEAAARLIVSCRNLLARRFGVSEANRVVITSGCTDSLNQVLHGMLRAGDRVVACQADHNAILRTLHACTGRGVQCVLVEGDGEGRVRLDCLRTALEAGRCRLLVLTHASNVTGAVNDLDACLSVARDFGVPVIVDAAQSAGLLPLSVDAMGIAALCFSAHKAIGGPPGVGALCLGRGVSFPPLRQGGGGSDSASLQMPSTTPEAFETGTPNVPGIAGLYAALEDSPANLNESLLLRTALWERLNDSEAYILYGPAPGATIVPVLSFEIRGVDPQFAATMLDQHGICTRAGLHCAPGAHRAIGSFNRGGTIRVSFGRGNRIQDVDRLVDALSMLTGIAVAS